MSFNSFEFILFFSIVFFSYYLIPHRLRWIFLLLSSYIFYMAWKPEYILLIILTTLITYFSGEGIKRAQNRKKKKRILIFSVSASLSILFVFKYSNFFISTINSIFPENHIFTGINIKLILPVGISFYTFQALSYVIDVYRGVYTDDVDLGHFAVYVSFFPQLVAGPIEKSVNLLPQIYKKIIFNYDRIVSGLRLMLWGFFKKIVIADNAAEIVNRIYNNVHRYDDGIYFLLATFLFAFQIYCDFSGYSDIAIGAARTLGIDLMKNFDRPYHAKSISEFWRRWHISLSVWLRDYLFLPVSYTFLRRFEKLKLRHIKDETLAYIGGIFVTMFLGGLWHGASWTFVLWGSVLGLFMISSRITRKIRKRIVRKLSLNEVPFLYNSFRILFTFSLINFSWIFFRANSISDAFYIIGNIFDGTWEFLGEFFGRLVIFSDLKPLEVVIKRIGITPFCFYSVFIGIGVLFLVQKIQSVQNIGNFLNKSPIWFRWIAYFSLIFLIIYLGSFKIEQFIYFQF